MAYSNLGACSNSRNVSEANDSEAKIYRTNILEWKNVLKSIEDAQNFLKAYNSPKAATFVKFLVDSVGPEQPLPTISIPVPTIRISDLGKIQAERPSRNDGVLQSITTTSDRNFLQNIPKHFFPAYKIESFGEPIPGGSCSSCNSKLSSVTQGIHCICCGKLQCIICVEIKSAFHLGLSNLKKPMCSPCSVKCDEINALTWIQRAEYVMKCGEYPIARTFLEIGYMFSKRSGLNESSKILKAFQNVELESFKLQDYKTSILCLKFQHVNGFGWGLAAENMCKKGKPLYPYGLACLRLINETGSSSSDSKKWEALGDRLGNFHVELATFCYNQCGSQWDLEAWMKKATFWDETKEGEEETCQKIVFACLEQAVKFLPHVQMIIGMVDKLFCSNKHRLALHLMKCAKLNNDQVVSMLCRWYNGVKSQNMMTVVISLMKYIVATFDPRAIRRFPRNDPPLLLVSQMVEFSSYTKDAEIIRSIDKVANKEEFNIPLAFLKIKNSRNWAELQLKADRLGCRHAAKVFRKIKETEEMLVQENAQENVNEYTTTTVENVSIFVGLWVSTFFLEQEVVPEREYERYHSH